MSIVGDYIVALELVLVLDNAFHLPALPVLVTVELEQRR